MNVEGLGSPQHITRTLGNGPPDTATLPHELAGGGVPGSVATITNDQGQSLMDIRDELKGAVAAAMQDFDGGGGDFRAAIQDAIESTLEQHGFDPQQVKGAMQEAGLGPLQAMSTAQSNPMMAMLGGSSDLASLLENDQAEEDIVQSFLAQFRAGIHLDLEI